MSDPPEVFLSIILPTLDRMRENADTLANSAEYARHLNAAHDLIDDLCQAIKGFLGVGLPQLLGANDPLPANPFADLAWLNDVGIHLDRVFRKNGLDWPPPPPGPELHPPAIVRDLRRMYNELALRHTYFSPVTADDLLTVVAPVGDKACNLQNSINALLESEQKPSKSKLIRMLAAALSATALGITFLQGPAAVNDFRTSGISSGIAWSVSSRSPQIARSSLRLKLVRCWIGIKSQYRREVVKVSSSWRMASLERHTRKISIIQYFDRFVLG